MSLLGTKATLGGVILVAGQLLFSANVQAATEDHIYGGEFCQEDYVGDGSIDHSGGRTTIANSVSGYQVISCPVPRLSKALAARNSMTVKVAVHDGSAANGVTCTLESMPQYNNSFAVSNYFSASTTGGVEKDTTLTLTVKPVDALGAYRMLCVMTPNSPSSVMGSAIYSYEVIETY